MSLGASLFLIAVGAILHFAVTATLAGVDIQVVGTILMVIGVIGFVISLWIYFARRARPAAATVGDVSVMRVRPLSSGSPAAG